MNLTEKEIIDLLKLVPHPTCGFVKHTYQSQLLLPKNVLPPAFGSDRIAGSVMYFLVSEKTPIKLHKILSDQMYHFYFGAPLEVLLLYPNGKAEIKILGHDIGAGMMPQLFIPGDTFHVSRTQDPSRYSLLATSEWIGVEPRDVELGEPDKLIPLYPDFEEQILQFYKK